MSWLDILAVFCLVFGLLAVTLYDLLKKKDREHKQLLQDKDSNISCRMRLSITNHIGDCEIQKTEIESQSFSQQECWQSYDKMKEDLKVFKNF